MSDWRRSGECKKCGDCCRHMVLGLNPNDARSDDFQRWVFLHGGVVRWFGEEPFVDVPVPCRELAEDNTCKIHKNKPLGCAMGPLHYWHSLIHLTCGYSFTRSG